MLPRKNRLCKKKDFDQVFKKGKTVFGVFLGLKCLKKTEQGAPRFGVIVSNKISKKAVERNLVKRRIKAVLSKEHLGMIVCDAVIITLPTIKNKKTTEISRELAICFKKIKQGL